MRQLEQRLRRLENKEIAANIPFAERWWLDLASMTEEEIAAERARVVTMAEVERDWWEAAETEC